MRQHINQHNTGWFRIDLVSNCASGYVIVDLNVKLKSPLMWYFELESREFNKREGTHVTCYALAMSVAHIRLYMGLLVCSLL